MRRNRFIAGCLITVVAVACALGDSLLAEGLHGEGISFLRRTGSGADGMCGAPGVDGSGGYCGIQIPHHGRHLHGLAGRGNENDDDAGVPGFRLLPDGWKPKGGTANSQSTDDQYSLPNGALVMTGLLNPTFGYGFFDPPGGPGSNPGGQGSGNPSGNGSTPPQDPPGNFPPTPPGNGLTQDPPGGVTPPGNGSTNPTNPSDPANPSDPSNPTVPVPEPLSLSLLAAGLALAAGMRRTRAQ